MIRITVINEKMIKFRGREPTRYEFQTDSNNILLNIYPT